MNKVLQRHLTKNDLAELMSLSHQSLACRNHDDLKKLVLDIKRLFYFENAVCAQGNVLELVQDNKEPNIDVCDISYPPEYLDLYFENQYYFTDAVFCEFITHLYTMNSTVFFFYSGLVSENDPRTEKILKYIIPFYSDAYKRVLKKASKPSYRLTDREIEVLNWIKEGKSSWDISMILSCSKRTVDFHVNNIKHKLNAVTRAQAVAIGLQHGIIRF